LTYGYSRIE